MAKRRKEDAEQNLDTTANQSSSNNKSNPTTSPASNGTEQNRQLAGNNHKVRTVRVKIKKKTPD